MIFALLLGMAFNVSLTACQSEEEQPEPFLDLSQETLVCLQKAQTAIVDVKSNVDWKASVPTSDSWCRATAAGNVLTVALTENEDKLTRETVVTVTAAAIQKKIQVRQLGQEPDILLAEERINLKYRDTLIHINVVSNVDFEVIVPDEVDWIIPVDGTRSMVESKHSFRILENSSDEIRFTNMTFKATEDNVERSLMIRQSNRDKTYNPGEPGGLGDILIPISSATASQEHPGEGIEKSFDGSAESYYHSPWSGTVLPVQLDYFFETPQEVDYFIYKPRVSGDNGVFGKFDLYVSTSTNAGYEKVDSYDFNESTSPSRIRFSTPLVDVKSFRFVVNSGKGGFVSCGEMEFYRNGAPIVGVDEVFADELYSELKPDVTQRQIDGIENVFFRTIAQSLFDKTYHLLYRVQEYEPYREIDDLARELKTSGYNPFENPTGIYFKGNDDVIVIVGDTYGEKVQLKVYDFDATRRGVSNVPGPAIYPLDRGINRFHLKSGGLGYIEYFTPNWKTASRIKIHIPSGIVNGYFDKNRDAAGDWTSILNGATYGCMDIKGDFINLVFGVGSLKQYCNDGMQLIKNYDKITELEHEVMGLMKYDRRPKNHMFSRVVEKNLFADGWGAGYGEWAMNELASPTKSIKEGVWCIAHELGHVNQIRPGLKWVSTSEVTNNVYSVCARYKFNREDLNLEHERVNDGDGNNVLGGRFNSYLNYGIVKGEQWLCQKGQDKLTDYQNGGDHFVKLCPLWQLLLYYREIAGKPDWYGDVAEIVRTTDDSNLTNGQLQLNFMKNTCDVVKEDLTDFFIKAGMLKPIDKELDDYAREQMTITQADCDELVRYASKYPKPATPVLYYLTANSEKAYKERLPVEGVYNKGLKVKSNERIVVEHDVWKNVAVFETYQGDELKYVAMVGTDSPDLSTTLVRYPNGSTRIEAVAWDGKRTLVYGKR